MNIRTILLAPLAFLLIFGACDVLSSDEGTGTLELYMTDEPFPFDLVDETNVTISNVEIIGAEEGDFTITDETETIDLLELQDGVTTLLGTTELPEGRYPQIRLMVDEAEIVMNSGDVHELTIPSGYQTGIKIVLPDFTIEAGETEELTLDFDVEQSFVVQGSAESEESIEGFTFKPTIIPLELTGENMVSN